ncbi:MAG: hypothetical protein ACD_46C00692G0003 [uncultured bacterium]|nr:MAG: hypothetical protein ACD_46C00692G0003 [uncultured bacterium]
MKINKIFIILIVLTEVLVFVPAFPQKLNGAWQLQNPAVKLDCVIILFDTSQFSYTTIDLNPLSYKISQAYGTYRTVNDSIMLSFSDGKELVLRITWVTLNKFILSDLFDDNRILIYSRFESPEDQYMQDIIDDRYKRI